MSQEDCEVAALPKTAIVRQALRITAHLGEAQLSREEKPRSSSHIMDLALIGVVKSIGLDAPENARHRHH